MEQVEAIGAVGRLDDLDVVAIQGEEALEACAGKCSGPGPS